jgi:hypothetical protein
MRKSCGWRGRMIVLDERWKWQDRSARAFSATPRRKLAGPSSLTAPLNKPSLHSIHQKAPLSAQEYLESPFPQADIKVLHCVIFQPSSETSAASMNPYVSWSLTALYYLIYPVYFLLCFIALTLKALLSPITSLLLFLLQPLVLFAQLLGTCALVPLRLLQKFEVIYPMPCSLPRILLY